MVSALSLFVTQSTAPAFALPQGGQVSAGSATISSGATRMDINQSSPRAILDWGSFNIGGGETVSFNQPNSGAVSLNRIHDANPSRIDGSLIANGQVWLVNSQGIAFGSGAQVNVGGLLATSSDIDNGRFMSGDDRFDIPGNPSAAIRNSGSILAADGGVLALAGPNVLNNGLIRARLGKVQLASGDTFAFDLYGDGLINLQASPAITSQLVANGGWITAEGGSVRLTAAAARNTVDSLINMDGLIAANSVGGQQGEITLYAEGSNAVANNITGEKGQREGSSTVLVSGVLDASGRNPGERGGRITVTGDNVALLDGTLMDASGYDGKNGTTSGKVPSAVRDGSAGGDIRVGGDYLGGGDTPTAKNLYVYPDALILNDALNSGDAGRTIFWSDGTAQFYGNVYARALGGKPVDTLTWNATSGGNPGDGGFVETSGHGHLNAGGYVDLTASNGNRGTYFLDPTDIAVYGNVDPAFVSTDGSIDLASSLKLWLDASDTSKLTLTYSTDGLSGATATGTAGSNSITTSIDVASAFEVGARIRLGSAGAVTTADTLGPDTYTVASISGTTITLANNLTQSYTGSTLYRGLVSQLSDKSGQGNNATQGTAANMPLWVSNGQNGLGVAWFYGAPSQMAVTLPSLTTFTLDYAYNRTATNSQAVGLGYSGAGTTFFGGYNNGTGSSYIVNDAGSFGGANTGADNASRIELATRDGANLVTYYKNSASYGSFTLGGSFTADRVGRRGGEYASAYFYEVLVYNAAQGSTPRNLVEQYQSAKWGIALTPPGTGATEAAKATASDGYSAFTTRYLERLSQSADISLQATNNVNLDFKGDTLALAAGRNLTLTAGNQITTLSSGNITASNGAIAFNAANGILLNHAFTLNSGGGDVSLNANVTLGANQSINAGTGTLTFGGEINGAKDLTASAASISFGGALGGTTPLGNVSLTSSDSMSLPAITATSVVARTTGATADMTLNGTITASGAGNAIMLATEHDMINNAGASPLVLTGGGRFIGYSHKKNDDTNPISADQIINGFDYGSLPPGSIAGPTYNGSQNTWVYYPPTLVMNIPSTVQGYISESNWILGQRFQGESLSYPSRLSASNMDIAFPSSGTGVDFEGTDPDESRATSSERSRDFRSCQSGTVRGLADGCTAGL